MFVGKLADRLAEAGHDVVLYQPIMNPEIANLTGSKHARFIERESYNALPHLSFVSLFLTLVYLNILHCLDDCLAGLGRSRKHN